MIKNPVLGSVVFVDYDNEGFESLASVLEQDQSRVRVKFLKDGTKDVVWVDYLFEVLETFAGPIMIDWRIGFGSEPV